MSSAAAPLLMLTTGLKAYSQIEQGKAEERMYDAKSAEAVMKGRSEAIAYKQQGANVLTRLNENFAAIIARSSAGGVLATSGSAVTTARFGEAEAAQEYFTTIDNAKLAKSQAQVQADQYTMAGDEAKKSSRIAAVSTLATGAFTYGQL